MIKILRLTSFYEEEYSAFVNNHPKALFYYQLKYRNLVKELLVCKDEYYILLDNNKIRAVLPMLYKDGEYGRVYNSLPYYGANGSILAENELYYNRLLAKYNEVIQKSAVVCFYIFVL